MATAKPPHQPKTDIDTVRLVIHSAVTLGVLSWAGGIALTIHGDKDVALVMLGPFNSLIGGLLGFLIKPTVDKIASMANPTPVKLMTTPDDPINVADQTDKPTEDKAT